jgi:hypothetical protein
MIFIHIYVQNMRNEQFDENAQMKQYAHVEWALVYKVISMKNKWSFPKAKVLELKWLLKIF